MNYKKFLVGGAAAVTMLGSVIGFAGAETLPTIDFESPYTVGNINGQQGWVKTGAFDVEVVDVSVFPNASLFGFGDQALRISNSVTSGSFGDQTFSPALANAAGESSANTHFEASFSIGSTTATQQAGLTATVSPDDGNGSRMSFLRFEDQADGIHVIFFDATNPGPLGTVSNFVSSDIATIDRTSAHTVKFEIDFVAGEGNDVVKIYVDNVLKKTGTTWENYYRFDPEQNGNGNVVPTTSKLLFRQSGTAVPANAGNGYLVDNVGLSSSAPVVSTTPTDKNQCKDGGWMTFNSPTFKNQGQCVSYVQANPKAGK